MRKVELDKDILDMETEFILDFIKLRHDLGLTQKEMSEKSNVLRDKIAKIEAGLYSPNLTSLLKILGPLGYTVKIEKRKKTK